MPVAVIPHFTSSTLPHLIRQRLTKVCLTEVQGCHPLTKPTVLVFQTHTESSPSLVPLPPLQPRSSSITRHLLLIARPFLSFKSQLRCDFSREALPNCSEPFPGPLALFSSKHSLFLTYFPLQPSPTLWVLFGFGFF